MHTFDIFKVNKTIPEKAPTSIPVPLDPIQALVQQMGGLHSLQSRLTGNSAISNNSGIPTGPVISGNGTIPTGPNLQSGPGGLPGLNLPTSLQSDSLPTNLQGLHNTIPPSGLSVTNIPGLPGSLPNNLPSKPPLSNVDPLVDNPINNLLRQFASKPQTQQVKVYLMIKVNFNIICLLQAGFVMATEPICGKSNQSTMATATTRNAYIYLGSTITKYRCQY